jgi:hypothetical protein
MKKKSISTYTIIAFGISICCLLGFPWIKLMKVSAFINANIKFHNTIRRSIIDGSGNVRLFDPFKYENLYVAKANYDSLLLDNQLIFEQVPDEEAISSISIRHHIRRALQVWTHSPVSQQLSFRNFLEYILPYRSGAEPWSDYSTEITGRYSGILDSTTNQRDPVEAASRINNELKTWLKFDLRSHAELNEPSILGILDIKLGSCNSLAQFATQACRAIGVPTAIDECPYWAHRNSGHAWNVVLDTTGKWIPFSAADKNPYEFMPISDSVKAPKIFRRLYSKNPHFQPPFGSAADLPPVFRSPNYLDVTEEYVSTSEVIIRPDMEICKGCSVLYLAVFNADQWCIVAWAEIRQGIARFTSIGNDSIVYLPVFYKDDQIVPAAEPFIVTDDTAIQIIPDTAFRQSFSLPIFNRFYAEDWKIGYPEPNCEMELLYWDHGWQSAGKSVTDMNGKLNFEGVPSNSLYLLRFGDRANTWQRIFQIHNGEPVWY